NQEVFDTFRKALKRRRRIVYSGLFKEGATLYDEGDLDYLLEKDDTEYEWLLSYVWQHSEESYNKHEIRALTDEEKEEVNGQVIDEASGGDSDSTHEGFKDIWVRDVKGNVVDVRMHKETLIWLWEYLDSHRVELPNKNSIDFENVEGALDSAVSQ